LKFKAINQNCFLATYVYRSPTAVMGESNVIQIENFNSKLDNFLHELYAQDSDSFVFLQANINLLKLNNSNPTSDNITTLHNNGYLQLISKATRIIDDSYSLIDHILCKSFKQTYKSGTLLLDISDHFLTFLSLPFNMNDKPKHNQIKKKRVFSFDNMSSFKAALQNINWWDVYNCNDTDRSFELFWDIFYTLFDLHFPLTSFNFNKKYTS
jgi:hypothetical protein